jgi:hypothetical protein
MADMDAVDIAFRTRCAALVVCTTGSTTLEATAGGYARSSGSFLTDGFAVGMEVTPSGFTQTTPSLITAVSALAMSVSGGRTVQTSGSGRTLSVGFPALRGYDNTRVEPITGRHYVETELVPAPTRLLTFPADGGTREDTGIFVVRWYGIADTGAKGLRQCLDALSALFRPGSTLPAGTDTVRVRADSGPFASTITQRPGGFALVVFTIPWRVYRANSLAA